MSKRKYLNHKVNKMINEALSQYGAQLTEDDQIINTKGHDTGLYITQRGNRRLQVRIADQNNHLVFSGPIEAKSIEKFVESFWYWEKVK